MMMLKWAEKNAAKQPVGEANAKNVTKQPAGEANAKQPIGEANAKQGAKNKIDLS